jgi:hypothetical protein
MREDVKVTKVYRFEELSEEAQGKAMEKLCDVNVDYPWWDCVYEDAKTIGVKIEEFDLDISHYPYCHGQFNLNEWDVAENILKEHGKDCETYKDAYEFLWDMALAEDGYYEWRQKSFHEEDDDFDPDSPYETDYCRQDDDFDPNEECLELLANFRQMIFEDYRSLLQTEYDYLTSVEAIRETIDVNEYEFTEDGRIY